MDNIAQFASDSVVTDSSGWTLLSGSFVAQSSGQWLYLGNFFDHASVTTIVADPNCPDEFGYYYFDDICLSLLPGECPTVTGSIELSPRTPPHAWVAPGSACITVAGLDTGRSNQY